MYYVKGLLLLRFMFLLAGCGEASQEKIIKKLDNAWSGKDGYEIEATMEMNSNELKKYAIEVWHTEPEFYKVAVKDENNELQLILRIEEGVFIVTPSTNKSYKFQSEWPHKNSQAYMLEGLLQQINNDEATKMDVQEKLYVCIVGLKEDKSGFPIAKIMIDKKILKPKSVVLLDENEKEQVSIAFEKIEYASKYNKADYALEKYSENKEKDEPADITNTSAVFYPQVAFESQLLEEQTVNTHGVTRTVLTYGGEKSFTLVQQPSTISNSVLPVFAPGDPTHIGNIVGAMTDFSISWQQIGKDFFVASNDLTTEQLVQVASSLIEGSVK